MYCIVTAGPTFEPLDEVRRLTNTSTGALGTQLAGQLARRGARVTLLRGVQSTVKENPPGVAIQPFTTTDDLWARLEKLGSEQPSAIFHAAAVSDFKFGCVWEDAAHTCELSSGKLSTRSGSIFAELLPTPKLLPRLRVLFPRAKIVGWKFEVEGGRDQALQRARRQITGSRTDACVVNGPAFGSGLGLLTGTDTLREFGDREALCEALATFVGLPC